VLIACSTEVLGFMCLVFSEPILSVHLVQMGMSESNAGLVFGLGGMAYALASPVAGYLCTKFSRKTIT